MIEAEQFPYAAVAKSSPAGGHQGLVLLPGGKAGRVVTFDEWTNQLPPDQDPSLAGPNYPVDPGPRLYHYTPLDGLFGVVTKRVLWASDMRFLNDETEYLHGLQTIAETMDDRMKNATGFELDVFQAVKANFDGMIPRRRFCVTCFSEAGDVLSQWRGYGGSVGVSIGFRYHDLLKLAQFQECHVVKCIYVDKDKKSVINSYLDTFVPWALSFKNQGRRWDLTLLSKLYQFALIAAACKPWAFHEEQEWRVITRAEPLVQLRPTPTVIKPYFEFELAPAPVMHNIGPVIAGEPPPKTRPAPQGYGFDHVIVGPSGRRGLVSASVDLLLEQYVTSYVITESKVPYRTF